MFEILLFIALIISSGINVYFILTRPEISVEKALKLLKKSLVRMVIFYQSNYPGSDQVQFIVQWLKNINFEEVPDWQFGIFKEFVNSIKKRG